MISEKLMLISGLGFVLLVLIGGLYHNGVLTIIGIFSVLLVPLTIFVISDYVGHREEYEGVSYW